MSTPQGTQSKSTLVPRLATLLRNNGDCVLDGSSTLTLQVSHLQHLTRLFEQHLISRTHQHGFLALPSHPADTTSLLQLQFLFDVLQKTLSLKLVSPTGSRLQSVVKIFPFKSLRHLELKRIPPHCLEGLRGLYSQLEVFTCSKSLSSLEELLSLCGGDLSSALPWLELHTLNFSYNSISCLDQSLSLLNVLKSLDLSHNRIQDCAEFLKPLSELEHLNLAYNNLQRAPQLGLSARVKLSVLILRNNELETINGVELLSSLQHLDLAYNLLLEHSQLAPLSILHCLNMLILEGNPLFFQKTHRSSTVCHLSPRAAFQKFRLDGCLLSTSELAVLPKSGQLIGQMGQAAAFAPPPVGAVMERGSQEFSSGGGELSDSLSVSEVGVSRLRKKKSKGKVKVRRASISEPSDTDHELRVDSNLQEIVLHHQKDIERMDSFRDQLGEDWLRYQHHLDTSVHPATTTTTTTTITTPAQLHASNSPHTTTTPIIHHIISNGRFTPSPSPPKEPSPERTALAEALDAAASPLMTSEPKDRDGDGDGGREPEGECDLEAETESTLRWGEHSRDSRADSTLERMTAADASAVLTPTPQGEEDGEEEEGDDDQGVDLCLPLLVGVVSEDEEGEERRAPGPVFLRVRQGLLLEVDMQRGRVRRRVELDSLQQITHTQQPWGGKEDGESLPALKLHFSLILRERRQRCYVMLDENPQQALQDLQDILSRVVEENVRRVEENRPRGLHLQCLRCRAEFSQRGPEGSAGASDRLDGGQELQGFRNEEEEEETQGAKEDEGTRKNADDSTGSGLVCPECNSDHVIQLVGQSAPSTSTPVHSDVEDGGEKRHFRFDDPDTPKRQPRAISNIESQLNSSVASGSHLTQEATKTEGEPSDTFMTATSGGLSRADPQDEDYGWADQSVSQPVSYHTADGGATDLSSTTESQEEQELAGSYRYGVLQESQADASDRASPAHFDLLSEDFEAVDHRLKLFLDVEVFEAEEELHSFLKMSTVKFGDPVEFPSLLVLSDQCIYILEITSEAQGQPSDWMQKRFRHRLCELSYLEVGLGSQSIHMEFAEGGSAYTLLVRDSNRCKRFFSRLTGIVRELAPRSDSKLKAISTTRLTPQHHLWPLVSEGTQSHEDEDNSQPQFLYVLAFIRQDHSLAPVTVLATRETLYLVDEDHQWSKSQLPEPKPNQEGEDPCGVTIQETQPISCVSSVHLFSSNPCRVDIQLYDEVLKQERTWALQTECGDVVQALVEWVRTQWEAMFGVKLITSTQELPS